MQEQTPAPKKRKKRPVKGKSARLSGNNPYQNVQPKSNNLPGFTLGGSVY